MYSDLFFRIEMQNEEKFLDAGPARLAEGIFCAPFLKSGQYEALLYFASPFWFCAKLKDPMGFLTGLEDIGKRWKIFASDDTIVKFMESRFQFYAENVNNLELPYIIYYWMFTKPLSEPPKNKSDFEFPPMDKVRRIPLLSKLMNEVNSLEKI